MSRQKRLTGVFFLGFILFLYGSFEICNNKITEPLFPFQVTPFREITPNDAWKLIQENQGNPNFVILDVRTPKEFLKERITGAININFYAFTFNQDISRLDKLKTYLVYCKSGVRSGGAIKIMKRMGFKKVFHLSRGIEGWEKSGLPIFRGP